MTIQVTEKTFDETVEKGIVLLDWWAAWCGPCRAFAPIFEAAAARHPDIVFGKIDTDAERGLAAAFEIRSIPTLMAFRDGILVFAQPGAFPASSLDKLIAQVRALDMDAVRRQVGEARRIRGMSHGPQHRSAGVSRCLAPSIRSPRAPRTGSRARSRESARCK